MSIWSDVLLDQYTTDASQDINKATNCLFHRFFLATAAGTSVYTLPNKVRGVTRVTWRGKRIDPIMWDELAIISPGTVYVSSGIKIETSESRPQFYALHPTNVHDIRFYPTPDESFITTGDPYSPTVNEARCTISCWRHIDLTDTLASLPLYIDRRTTKAFVLWKAYEKEGKGQNLAAAAFYKKKYQFLIKQFTAINEGAYVSKHYSLEDEFQEHSRRRARPILPTNFERIIY